MEDLVLDILCEASDDVLFYFLPAIGKESESGMGVILYQIPKLLRLITIH